MLHPFSAFPSALLALSLAGCSGGSFKAPGQMVLDGNDVVLTALDDTRMFGKLIRTTPGGGDVAVLAGGTADLDVGSVLAADATSFYFPARTPQSGFAQSIFSIARAGGAPVKLADTLQDVNGIAVAAGRVYWTGSTANDGGGIGSVTAVPTEGGTPVVIASGQTVTGGLAVDANRVYWTVDTNPSNAAMPTGGVLSAPLAGGTPTSLATSSSHPAQIVSDGTSLFWLELGQLGIDCSTSGGQLMTLPAEGGAEPVVMASSVAGAIALAVSGSAVYLTAVGAICNAELSTDGSVVKVPRGGGVAVTLATGVPGPGAVVIDGSSLYVTTESGDTIDGAVRVEGD